LVEPGCGAQLPQFGSVFFRRDRLVKQFAAGCQGADISVIEGAMGLFDGLDLEGSDSTAAVAKAVKHLSLWLLTHPHDPQRRRTCQRFQEFEADTDIPR
jgi:cobyrinic acid a,c-diamide synthase